MIDCDVHARPPAIGELEPFLPEYWRDYIREAGFVGSAGLATVYPPRAAVSRTATLDEVRAHLDHTGADAAVLTCVYGVESFRNYEFATVLATAVNDWLAAEWLDADPRLRAGIVVKPEDTAGAVAELERRAQDARFVQVLLPGRTERPYGNRAYRPLLAAAARLGLPVAIHFGGNPGSPATAVGAPSYYLEEVVGMTQVFQAQLTSLVAEGALEQLPGLRVVLAEGGWTWLPPLLWRLDKEWKGLGREIPWAKRSPSAAIREQVRLTVQPIDAPAEPQFLLDVLDQLGSDGMLVHSSDFPHPHAGGLEEALDGLLSAGRAERIRDTNPRELYRL